MDKAVTAAVSVESVEAGSVVEIDVEATDTIEAVALVEAVSMDASVLTVGTVEKDTSDVNFVAAVPTTPPLPGKQRQS